MPTSNSAEMIFSIRSSVRPSCTSSFALGNSWLNMRMTPGKTNGAIVGMKPTVRLPCPSRISDCKSTLIPCSSSRIFLARGSSNLPTSVSTTLRPSRSKRGSPISFSSFLICWLREGWATSQRSAARLKPPVSTMATKYSSW